MRLAICGVFTVWLSLVCASQAQTISAQELGACAWSQLSADLRQAYLTAHHRNMNDGMEALSKQDDAVLAAVAACAGRNDIPAPWAQAAVASKAIQNGAANELSGALGLSAPTLDAAWEKAPPDTIQCFRANAAKVFGKTDEACPDPKAPLWFLQALKISPTSNRPAAEQALYYFNAKAQEQWAEALIAKFKEQKR